MQIFTAQFEREDGIIKADLLVRDEVIAADIIGEAVNKGIYRLTIKLAESVSKAFEPDFGGAQVEPTVVIING